MDEAASVFFNYYLLLSTAQYKRNVRRVRRSTEMLVTTLDIITLAIDSSRASVNPPMMTKHRRSEEQRGKTNFTRWHRAMMWKVSVELESRYTIISTTYLSHICCRTWRSSLGGFTALTTHDDIALKFKTQLRPIWWLNGGVHIAQVWNWISVSSSCCIFRVKSKTVRWECLFDSNMSFFVCFVWPSPITRFLRDRRGERENWKVYRFCSS